MKVRKIREVKTPTRGTKLSAGIDFYVPEFNSSFLWSLDSKNINTIIYDKECIRVHPSERVLIPTGIQVNVPKNHVLIAFNKSGVSSKKGLDVLANVVDEDYQGELHISLVNTGSETVKVYENEKILQFILLPVNYASIDLVNSERELYSKKTARSSGGFGSTDKKLIKVTLASKKDKKVTINTSQIPGIKNGVYDIKLRLENGETKHQTFKTSRCGKTLYGEQIWCEEFPKVGSPIYCELISCIKITHSNLHDKV